MAQRHLPPLPCARSPLLPGTQVVLALLVLLPHAALACTSVMVGPNATSDGSLYLARTVDYADTSTAANNLVRVHGLAELRLLRGAASLPHARHLNLNLPPTPPLWHPVGVAPCTHHRRYVQHRPQ